MELDMNKRYETYVKMKVVNKKLSSRLGGECTDERWVFVGWGKPMNEEFCIKTQETKKSIIKTYRWLTGETEMYSYRKGGM